MMTTVSPPENPVFAPSEWLRDQDGKTGMRPIPDLGKLMLEGDLADIAMFQLIKHTLIRNSEFRRALPFPEGIPNST
jgi:hypothetical protein